MCGFLKKFEPKEAVPKDGFALFRRYARNRRRRSARRARGDFTVMIFIGTPKKRALFDREVQKTDADDHDRLNDHKPPRRQEKRCQQPDAEGKDGTVEFKNVNSGDLGLETEEEKKAAEDATAENKNLFDAMKDALDGKVKEVKVSTRLKDHPVCLSADGPLSIEMEKVLSKQPGSEGVKSDKVLELNVNHPVFAVLKAAQEAGDTDKLKKYSALLYAQAQLIEGLPVDDPAAYAEAVCSLMK